MLCSLPALARPELPASPLRTTPAVPTLPKREFVPVPLPLPLPLLRLPIPLAAAPRPSIPIPVSLPRCLSLRRPRLPPHPPHTASLPTPLAPRRFARALLVVVALEPGPERGEGGEDGVGGGGGGVADEGVDHVPVGHALPRVREQGRFLIPPRVIRASLHVAERILVCRRLRVLGDAAREVRVRQPCRGGEGGIDKHASLSYKQ